MNPPGGAQQEWIDVMRNVIVFGAGLLMVASLLAPARPAAAAQHDVDAVDFAFTPAAITINAGDAVVWTFSGFDHTVTSGTGAPETFDSGSRSAGQTYSRVFNTPGAYTYYCTFHGTPDGGAMAGTITVQAAAQNTATPTRTATRTATPQPTTTGTPQATATATVTPTADAGTSTPAPAQTGAPSPIVPIDPGNPGGGAAGGAVTPPSTGTGASGSQGGTTSHLIAGIAAASIALTAAGALSRRRA